MNCKITETIDKLYFLLQREKAQSNEIIFSEAIEKYISSKCNILSPSTVRGYRIMQKNSFDFLNSKPLNTIDEFVLQEWANINALKYASKTLHNQFGLITAVLKQNRIDLDVSRVQLKPKEHPKYIVPDLQEMSQIISLVYGEEIELPVLFALLLGLRQSEIAALKWCNYTNGQISIIGAKVPNERNQLVEKKTNKSISSTRTLKVPDYLQKRLDSLRNSISSDYISPLPPNVILKRFFKLLKGNNMRRFTMHSLRHANASLMLLLGVSDKYAMERLGQSTPYMLKTVYQHTFDAEKERTANIINDAINKLV